MDALTAAFSSGQSSSSAASGQQEQQGHRLVQQLVVGGQLLPAAAAEAVVQGGIAKSLLGLQRTPQVACQVLLQGERLLYAVPLMMFAGQPVRLVLLLEMCATPEAAMRSPQQQGVMYSSVCVVPFADVYCDVRSLGPCDWLSWVRDAVAAMQAA